MNARNFKEFLLELALLSRVQRERVSVLLHSPSGNKTAEVIEVHGLEGRSRTLQ